MSEERVFKGMCPTCDGVRSCDLEGHVHVDWTWDEVPMHVVSGTVDHYLLKCRGCETVFYQRDSSDDSDPAFGYRGMDLPVAPPPVHTITYPRPDSRTSPTWLEGIWNVDPQLGDILRQMYGAHDAEFYILAAIGARTAFDRATEGLKIDPALPFEKKLDALLDGGWIGETERETLDIVTDAGSAAAHRGWSPTPYQLNALFATLELFLRKVFVNNEGTLAVKGAIPARPPKKKPGKP
ncbi:MAG: DUF4145 domain-containing protein [Phenylobacterium sp.]|uniref:DUF4145 domain-containing protein n=1 Tax=Phenylobacterium sp. TaxID=1871053 RepID=UPI001A3045EC|nr:DUF4145 domain-containing protein [Phenylobacterium sp.]MBJ7408876.1 DUF4145 domain-containing protein [Phenylobacterium sp.]